MAKGRKKQARKKAPPTAAKGAGAPTGDAAPASEAVIEAKADRAFPGREGPFGRTATPEGGSDGTRSGTAPGKGNTPGALRQPGIPALLLWIAAGATLVAAVYFGSTAMRELGETRRLLGENTALSEQIDALEERLSQVEGEGRPERIAGITARIEKLEQDISGLGERIEETAALVGGAGSETSAADTALLARVDRIEQALDEIRLRLGGSEPGQNQPEAAAEGEPEKSGESESWWGFLGRLLKISRVDRGDGE